MANGSFSAIFNAAEATGYMPNTVKNLFGEEFVVSKEDPPPRVVWVPPKEESYGPPEGYAANGLNNPRIIHTRLSQWSIWFWGWTGYTAVARTGTGQGILTLSATPVDAHTYVVRIDTSGQSGAATWSYSIDGGSFTSAGAVASLTNVGSLGGTIALTNDPTATPSFVSGDTYTFSTPGLPVDQYDAAELLHQQILQSLRSIMWQDNPPTRTGYFYKALRLAWMQDHEITKFGRAGRILVEFHLAVTMPPYPMPAITSMPITPDPLGDG